MLRASQPVGRDPRGATKRPRTWVRVARDPQTAVIERFARATLWRSPLHQVVFLGLAACGAGWAINSLLSVDIVGWIRHGGVPHPALVSVVITMPLVLMLAGATGLRAALLLPQDSRANWIFRMNDDDARRPAQLDAVERLFLRAAIVPAIVCALPLQWAVLGADALIGVILTWLWGVLLVELMIRSWRRIPFTCSYIPGKRNIAETVLIVLAVFAFYLGIGSGLIRFSRVHPSQFLIACGILLTIVAAVRRHRLRSWGGAPLMFDDDPPEFAQPLSLS
jgi:hypothetical protein